MSNAACYPHLPRAFFVRETRLVARALLGQIVVHAAADGLTAGRIVETEAYLGPGDLASHAATRRKERIEVMWRDPGTAYIYRSYGIHAMLNTVAQQDDAIGAVLIRALEPVAGIPLMQERRNTDDLRALCSGPGKLCQAMAIRLDQQGTDLVTSTTLWFASGEPVNAISMSGRIGISQAKDDPWRYWETGSPFVSAHRRGEPFTGEDPA
ncbi:MAG TPA: DNA-3-methyladenine glycosylase [Devosia sp.]|nr:DNA-3-methyladenine glycosylase [Devosia sp.]